ncbi:MAG: response regulator transcription factor [Myxococcota bacterium]|nr:response regulator transcription factor [Myxococcota bacterium]
MTASAKNLLVVEDEEHLAAGLKLNFELEGYRVDTASTGREASERLLQSEGYDGIILDIMLPDMDGFELCRRLRGAGNFTPVLMLTARNAAEDRVTGLDVGADDYLAKPFDLPELLARVRSLLRRRGWDNTSGERGRDASVLIFGDTRINFDTHEAFRGEASITLTQLEFDLLRYFAENAGRVLSRAELLEKVWMLKNYPNTRTVDNFIVRLRRHFEVDPTKPQFFRSVRGTGYKFVWDGASLSRAG